MLYPQSKEESVALLRQVLAMLAQHDAAPNPVTFAVFFDHCAGTRPAMSAALRQIIERQPRLTDGAVIQLFQDHVSASEFAASERLRGDVQRVITSLADSAARTGHTAGQFGRQLDGLSGALKNDDATPALAQAIDAAREGTQQMQQSVQGLQSQVHASQREIDRLRDELNRSRDQALTCPLTGVLNRRGFDIKLGEMLAGSAPSGRMHCLVMLDIDHFKRINDSQGHVVGDRVIAGLGEVLKSLPAEPGMVCARYGGEEFAILLPGSSLQRAAQVAEAVCQRTRAMKLRSRQTQEVKVTVTISAGVAAWQIGEDAADFVAAADAALYRSKQSGRDRVTVS